MPPLKPGTTVGEAREILADFLREKGCYDICAACPQYPSGEGCCVGCSQLTRNTEGRVLGCGNPNLSCLSYTCAVLNRHLWESGHLGDFLDLVYGIPREGYRGGEPRPTEEAIQLQDPLREVFSPSQRREED